MPTHGSLSKAGKVRSQTPKFDAKVRKSKNPRVNNKRRYHNREILGRNIGQFTSSRRRGRR